jgi:hypothetical protein
MASTSRRLGKLSAVCLGPGASRLPAAARRSLGVDVKRLDAAAAKRGDARQQRSWPAFRAGQGASKIRILLEAAFLVTQMLPNRQHHGEHGSQQQPARDRARHK